MTRGATRELVGRSPWLWPLCGTLLLWLGMAVVRGQASVEFLVANSISASFLAIAAFGQMLVITSGGGAIDLSIPSVITIAAFVATGTINGRSGHVPLALVEVLLIGCAVGLCNGLAVVFLRIPPIIATMALGYVVTTVYLLYNEHFTAFRIAPLLLGAARSRLLGVPIIVYLAVAFGVAVALGLSQLALGQSLLAVGQCERAARLAGVKTRRVLLATYVVSGAMAALAGVLISARVGGAFLDMGASYLIQTIGAVVLGGTLIFGGRASTVGTLLGSVFLILLITTMQAAGLSLGMQRILEGTIIIAVLAAAGGRRAED